jgi:hypothetical protein
MGDSASANSAAQATRNSLAERMQGILCSPRETSNRTADATPMTVVQH